ncbi:hypothetical protein [Micromonospora zamorensis]|uniref:hypothetical protein n=1 Tax=Micromonospora zamorensis TaxID=709883 RepID=UPI0033AA1853
MTVTLAFAARFASILTGPKQLASKNQIGLEVAEINFTLKLPGQIAVQVIVVILVVVALIGVVQVP